MLQIKKMENRQFLEPANWQGKIAEKQTETKSSKVLACEQLQ